LAYREQALLENNNNIDMNITTAIKSNDDDDLFLKLSNNNSNGFTWQNIETIRASFQKKEPLLSTNYSNVLYDNYNGNNSNSSLVEDYDDIDNSNSLLKTRIKNTDEISPIKDSNITSALKYFQDNNSSIEEELQTLEKCYQEDLKALQLSYSKKKIELLSKYKQLDHLDKY
jgi:hypothetical protein